MDKPPYRLSRILTETYATPPSPKWRVQPPVNSNSRRTRQRFDSFRALAQATLAQASNANESPARRTSRNLTCGTPFGSLLCKSSPIDDALRLEHHLPPLRPVKSSLSRRPEGMAAL